MRPHEVPSSVIPPPPPPLKAGVFVSRSSVGLIKIKRVEVLSALQFINMVVWVLQTAVSSHGAPPPAHLSAHVMPLPLPTCKLT